MPGETIVILCDGEMPKGTKAIEALEDADTIVCCDASILKLLRYYRGKKTYRGNSAPINCIPDANCEFYLHEIEEINKSIHIVGDMDTLHLKYQKLFSHYIYRIDDQETNDQTKAFKFALSLHPKTITFLGISGGREDHTLANISLLADYREILYYNNTDNLNIRYGNDLPFYKRDAAHDVQIKAITDYGIFYPILDTCSFESPKGSQISIFVFDVYLKIKSYGLLYPTDNVKFDMWWKATLNETIDGSFGLEFSHKAKALVFIAHTNL